MRRLLPRIALRFTIFASASAVLVASTLALTSAATADTAVTTTVPFTFMGTNPCVVPMEDFVGTGKLHMVMTSNLSAGGMVQSHLQTNLAGLQATAMVSGKKYQVPESSTESYEFDSLDMAPFHTTLEFMVQFIRVGEGGTYLVGDDFYEHYLAHATVNANGIVTVDDLTDDVRCK
jgi:hypothetical protein